MKDGSDMSKREGPRLNLIRGVAVANGMECDRNDWF